MKKIMLITTGGTIASLNYKNGLKPSIDGNDITETSINHAKEMIERGF